MQKNRKPKQYDSVSRYIYNSNFDTYCCSQLHVPDHAQECVSHFGFLVPDPVLDRARLSCTLIAQASEQGIGPRTVLVE
jgi:hypothetical protein